jgi:hypothetical protein
VTGLLRMAARVREMVRRRAESDPVAVVSFDSRLRLWSDFTTSADQVDGAVRAMLLGGDAAPAADPSLSLAAHLEDDAAARAATAQEALLVLARALRPLPGAKSLVLVGHGFGQMAEGTWSGRVDETDGPYVSVRRALEDARASVFALDVTNADAHTLEAGLMQVAEDTGGFYARTHVFAGEAMARLERALEGHYVLTFPRPVLPVGEHAVAIALVGRKGTVLAKRSYRG